MAIGIALSPVPIIAVVLMLTTERARVNGPAFVLGWLLGLGIIGVLLLLVAARQFRSRPRGQDQTPMPKWMGAVDKFKPPAALGAGVLLAGLNPKNLLLAVAGAATIAQAGIAGGPQAIAYAVFAALGTIGVGAPVVIYFAMGCHQGAENPAAASSERRYPQGIWG